MGSIIGELFGKFLKSIWEIMRTFNSGLCLYESAQYTITCAQMKYMLIYLLYFFSAPITLHDLAGLLNTRFLVTCKLVDLKSTG